jgi:hypothetical protein
MAEGDKTYKVRYKNHCTPQERLVSNGRYYLDSDCGRKLTGNADVSATFASAGTLTAGVAISSSATEIVAAARDFVYIKNTGDTEVTISLTTDATAEYVIALAAGEAFASEIHTSARVFVKSTGTSTIEHFQET